MQKTKIKIRANLIVLADACKAAPLEVRNKCNNLVDVAKNNGETEIDFPNIRLVKFGI